MRDLRIHHMSHTTEFVTSHKIGSAITVDLIHSLEVSKNSDNEISEFVGIAEDFRNIKFAGITIPVENQTQFVNGLSSLGVDLLAEIRKLQNELEDEGLEDRIKSYPHNY